MFHNRSFHWCNSRIPISLFPINCHQSKSVSFLPFFHYTIFRKLCELLFYFLFHHFYFNSIVGEGICYFHRTEPFQSVWSLILLCLMQMEQNDERKDQRTKFGKEERVEIWGVSIKLICLAYFNQRKVKGEWKEEEKEMNENELLQTFVWIWNVNLTFLFVCLRNWNSVRRATDFYGTIK